MSWVRESSLWHIAVEEGRVEEARRLVLSFGTDRLGQPDPETGAAIDRIEDLEALERLLRRTFTVASWNDLLVGE